MSEDVVAHFYRSKHKQTVQERAQSVSIVMRRFNNFVKSALISEALVNKRDVRVLDLCGGTGGDLSKYQHSDVVHVDLVDISDTSVEEAKQRYKKIQPPAYSAQFYCGDAFDYEWVSRHLSWEMYYNTLCFSITNVSSTGTPVSYQLVSCQFALHYAFRNKDTIQSAFRIIAWALDRNGRFIATIPNAAVIEDHLARDPIWKTEHFTIEALSADSYYFTMPDAVNRVPEYYIRPHVLVQEAVHFGLEVISARPLGEVYRQYRDLAKRMRVTDDDASIAARDGLYLAIVLAKK